MPQPKNTQNTHCLTITANGGLLRELRSKCHVSIAFNPHTTTPHPVMYEFEAIWDTGATGSVITQQVVDTCGLAPISLAQVHGVGGMHMSESYLVNMMLPNKAGFFGVRVTRGELTGVDVLIGMDIITRGDFVLTNMCGITVFTFRFPSQCRVDFTQEHGLIGGSLAFKQNHPQPKFSHGGAGKNRNKKPKKFGKNKK